MANAPTLIMMKRRWSTIPTRSASQGGFSLLIGLIFLIVLTVLGLTGASISNLDERMARNTRDRVVAFQAAEAALRDAHSDIKNTVGSTSRIMIGNGMTIASTTCDNTNYKGVCLAATSGAPRWTTYLGAAGTSVRYGEMTGLVANNLLPTSGAGSVGQLPYYLIEVMTYIPPDSSMSTRNPPVYIYRITALGFGADRNTQVVLQEVYKPV